MIIIRNRLIPFGRFSAINICGILFVKNDTVVTQRLINHERIHTAQIIELLVIPFYIVYIVEWLCRLMLNGDVHKAYQDISFEREAYANEGDSDYTARRSLFGQWRRVR